MIWADHTEVEDLSASVAQLDRALASEARCRRFESCQVHLKGNCCSVDRVCL